MKHIILLISALYSSLIFAQLPAPATEEDDGYNTQVRLESETATVAPGQSLEVAVVLEMKDHWHIYWRNHGDSGGKPEIQWDLPAGVTAGDIQWPVPARDNTEGLISYIYEGSAALLVPIRIADSLPADQPLTLRASVSWLECKDMCLPGEQEVSLTLPVTETPGEVNPDFTAYRAQIPADGAGEVTVTRTPQGVELFVEIPESAGMPELFFPGEVGLWRLEPAPTLTREEGGLRIGLSLLEGFSLPETIEGVLRFEDGSGIRIQGSLSETDGAESTDGTAEESTRATWYYLGLALLAGAGMNLLPCIFPVLGLKISSFVEQAHGDRSSIRTHALVFGAGVLVSMWVIAGGVAMVGGAWGGQFQDPRMVIGMLLVLTFFTMNLFGVFELGLGLTTVGGNLTRKQGYAGSFFQGVLLTVIGTPCTGPILVLVMAWMLAQPLWIGFLAFTLMGIGLASPYVILAFSPALLDRLPPPGNWMVTFKKSSAFAMVAFLWVLLFVLRKQIPSDGLIRVIGAVLLVCFAAWILGTWDTFARKPRTRIIAKGISLLVLVTAIVTAFTYKVPANEVDVELQARIEAGDPIRWKDVTPALAERLLQDGVPLHYQPWSPEKVVELRKQGVPIFVDFTAEWCTICKQNKLRALHRDEVMRDFAAHGVVTLRADWTGKDPVIAGVLKSFGRRGVPVYLLYDANGNEPVLLPEKLNPEMIHEALENL